MCAWYLKFIPHFSKLCEPLFQLKRKCAKFIWSKAAQNAFDITSPPALVPPNYSIPFDLSTAASSCGIDAVLTQGGRLIVFASRTLRSAERNYSVAERECLAVVWSLNKFRVYFSTVPVTVITDHNAFTKLTNGKGLSARMVRFEIIEISCI